MHVPLAELCIDVGTPMVTASYVSDAMQALHTRATQANVPILCAMGLDLRMDRCMLVLITAPHFPPSPPPHRCEMGLDPGMDCMQVLTTAPIPPSPPPHRCEMGLDPGMDHMSAVELIERMHALGGVVTSFTSNCGGLPSPEVHASAQHGAPLPLPTGGVDYPLRLQACKCP
jgi:hypothetical protein